MGGSKPKASSTGASNSPSDSPGSVSGGLPSPISPQASRPKGAGKGKAPLHGSVVTQNPEQIELQRRKLQSQLDRVKAEAARQQQLTAPQIQKRNANFRENIQKLPKEQRNVIPFMPKTKFGAEALRKRILSSLKQKVKPQVHTVRIDKFKSAPRHSLREMIATPHLKKAMSVLRQSFDKVTGYDSLREKVSTFGKERGLRANPSVLKMGMGRTAMVNQLLNNELNDELEKNRIAYMYLAALLLPEEFENIGIPDQYNSSRSGKPTVVTEYVVPFDSNGQVAAIISDDPLEHIRVLGAGTAQLVRGPSFRNTNSLNGQANSWIVVQNPLADYVSTDSYLVTGSTSTFKASDGFNSLVNPWNIEGSTESYPLSSVQVTTANGTEDYLMAPCKPGDTFSVFAVTPDTTMNGYQIVIRVIKYINGSYSTDTQSATVTGGTPSTGFALNAFTIDPDVVGVYEWQILNLAAGTDSSASATVTVSLSLAAGDIILPVGKATGEDVAFLVDYADEYRSGPCSVKTTYFGGYLENGLLLQGQLPNDNDFEIPPPNVTDWSLIPGITTKALNDASAPGAYCPMIRKDYSTSTWQSLQNPTDQPAHERVAVLIRANGAEAEYAKFRTIWQGQYRTMNQMPFTSDGLSNDGAIDLVMTWLMEMTNGGMDLVFGNDDHEACCDRILRAFEKERGGTTVSFFNGWFSGNETKLSNEGEIIA